MTTKAEREHAHARWTIGTCPTGKATYDTRAGAKATAKRLRPTRGRMRPYPCNQCNGWHIGHTGKHLWKGGPYE